MEDSSGSLYLRLQIHKQWRGWLRPKCCIHVSWRRTHTLLALCHLAAGFGVKSGKRTDGSDQEAGDDQLPTVIRIPYGVPRTVDEHAAPLSLELLGGLN